MFSFSLEARSSSRMNASSVRTATPFERAAGQVPVDVDEAIIRSLWPRYDAGHECGDLFARTFGSIASGSLDAAPRCRRGNIAAANWVAYALTSFGDSVGPRLQVRHANNSCKIIRNTHHPITTKVGGSSVKSEAGIPPYFR